MADVTDPLSAPAEPDREGAARVQSGGRGALVKLAVLAALVAGGAAVAIFTPVGDYLSRDGIGQAVEYLRGSVWAPAIFVAIYALATALAVPGSALTLAGGALFGTFWGTVFNSVGANIGANAAFLISRLLGRDGVERLAGDRLEKLDKATEDYGFRGLLTLRLIPLVPFNALNFGSGLTAISWPAYALATVIGILPGTVVYTMFADALLQGSQEASREAFVRVLISGGLLILLSFLPTILKKMNVKLPGASAFVAPLGPLFLAAGLAGTAAPAPAQSLPDPGSFTEVLGEIVRDDGVDYQALQADRARLDRYIQGLAATDPGRLEAASRNERLAFWINAYNACMLKLVADHYPIQKNTSLLERVKNSVADRPANSVWQITDVFTREHCPVAGRNRSQDQIEHEIIRPMGEPRIHFAVNCAAVSCPALAAEAYRGPALDAQLDRQVRGFMSDPRHFQVKTGDDPALKVNKVLDWFGEDFGGPRGLKDFFAGYLSGHDREVVSDPDTAVEFFEYDWTLNDVHR